MKITPRIWALFVILAILSIGVWMRLSYTQFTFLDLSVEREEALAIAKTYLAEEINIDPSGYTTATVFLFDDATDRYLQKAIGFDGEEKFIEKHNFDLFLWLVRFYRENEKEEFRLGISTATGEIVTFKHVIADSVAKESYDAEKTQERAHAFLENKFHLALDTYTISGEQVKKHDKRTDYAFAWKKNNVDIPWSTTPDTGNAKLLTSVTVSGNDILSFAKAYLEIPDEFSRYIQRKKTVGKNLSTAFLVVHIGLLMGAAFLVLIRKHHIIMHISKKFFIMLTAVLILFYIANFFNKFENILFNYQTTSSFSSYLWQYTFSIFVTSLLLAVTVLMPGLAGESLHYEVFPKNRTRTFAYYINSTVLSRKVAALIILGYLTAIIMAGIQSLVFHIGHTYMGVWSERNWIAQVSTAYLPFITALIIGCRASFTEEIIFRIFTLSWAKKVFKSTIIAVIISSVIWGYGHSQYLVFPMWFRGIEVTCLGIFLSLVFLRYGIIPVLVAHYCFDVFWVTSDYLLGKSQPFHFSTSLLILLLPLLFAGVAAFINKPEEEREMRWKLNRHQIYNLAVLKSFIQGTDLSTAQQYARLKSELLSHGWDVAVVEKALEEYSRSTTY